MELAKTQGTDSGFHLFEEEANPTGPATSAREADRALNSGRQLVFSMLGQRYCLPLRLVREVAEYQEPTPLPIPRLHLAGYVSYRGEALPLLDRCSILAVDPQTAARHQARKLVILQVQGEHCALAVDHLEHIMNFTAELKYAGHLRVLGQENIVQRVAFDKDQAILGLDFESLLLPAKRSA